MRTYQRPRAAFLADFRRVAEASLIQADILHSKALPTLQALVVYIAALRKLDPGHASWSLLGLVVRLAQALNLDRESPDESFFQSQIRRRLWHHICVLDSFFAYDRGSDYLIGPGILSRPLPTNLNDDDFDEISQASNVRARQGEFTDMNFALYQQEIFLEGHRRNLATTPQASSIESRIATMKTRHKELEQIYMAHCDVNIPFQRLTIRIGRLSADMSLLTTARPFSSSTPNTLLPIDTPWIVEMAMDVLRQTDELYKDTEVVQWVRRLDWTQWHPLVIVLSHLCSARGTPEAENAWDLVDRVMSYAGLHIADTTAGKLWRPLEMLYRKAQNFRLGVRIDISLLVQPQLPENMAISVNQAGLMPFMDQSEDFFATNQWFNLQVVNAEPYI
ncbi:Bikaverin cluster transcription factor bik5 [Pseudocercospora fuligena]|uniref:Bikaverin cluster transcription factor bik5 n=1 Tax=Pseudocercospora fuligena TaxID=685502 RepID=A0A8H6R6W9_9PEZI|nr:Bikaverin cluster transcription factor bik5 [Pseudocercospora fuligena]